MSTAKAGDQVQVHYTGKLTDGTVFDSSVERDPLAFTLGEGQVIAGFDDAVEGMEIGEEKSVLIPVDKAYGQRNDDWVFEVERAQMPEGMDPKIGDRLQVQQQNGNTAVVTVQAVGDDNVTLDANHPLAGRDLHFDLELVQIG